MIYFKFALLCILAFIFNSTSYGQSKSEMIEDTNELIEIIHMDTTLKSVTLQNEEFLDNMTDGGGELTGFFKNKKIYRIYQSIGISYGVEIKEFYYRKEKLIFVREKFYSYMYDDSLKKFDYTKTETKFKGQYYFKDNKLIHYITTGHNRLEESLEPEKVLLNESSENIRLIKQKLKFH